MTFTPQSVATFWAGFFAYSIAMSLLSGWWILQKKYAAKEVVAGKCWWFVSGSVARWDALPMQYHATFFITMSAQGCRLAVSWPMRFMHPPLQFSWQSISGVRTEPFLWVFTQTVATVTVPAEHKNTHRTEEKPHTTNNAAIKIRLRGRAGKAFLAQYLLQSLNAS